MHTDPLMLPTSLSNLRSRPLVSSPFCGKDTAALNTARFVFTSDNHFHSHDPPALRPSFSPTEMSPLTIPTRLCNLFVLTATLMVLCTMCTVESVRILRADADVATSVWDPSDSCSQPVRETTDNKLHLSCTVCLERPGCAVESTTGKCVSVSRMNATINVEYLIAGQTQYCDAIDNACSLCSADNATSAAVCRGVKGCVCVHQCELAEADHAPPDAFASSSFHIYYLLIGGALLTTTLIMLRLYKSLSFDIMSSFDLRMHARAEHAAKPLTMKLDGWRGFIARERQDQQSETVEIKLCPTRASEDASETATNDASLAAYETQRNLRAASTQEHEDTSKDDVTEYVSVVTPRSSDNDGERGLRL